MNNQIKGRYINAIREAKGLSLDDAADEHISRATISRIENGFPSSKLPYLLQLLGTNEEEIEIMYQSERKSVEEVLHYHLVIAEGAIDIFGSDTLGNMSKPIREAGNKIQVCHPDYPKMLLVQGKKWLKKGNYKKAEDYYFQAKDAVNQSDTPDYHNVKAAAYNDLGYISYLRNNLNRALYLINKGIQAFQPDREEKHIRYSLLSNQALYHEKLEEIDQAKECLELLWPEYNQIEQAYVKGLMYVVQTRIYLYENKTQDALDCIKKGIVVARLNKLKETAFTLLTIMGAIMRDSGNTEVAEDALITGMNFYALLPSDRERSIIETHLAYAKLLMDQQRMDEAEKHIKEAINLCTDLDDALRKTKSYTLYGEFYIRQGQEHKAIAKYYAAKAIAKKLQFNNLLLDILMHLATLFEETDHQKFQAILSEKYILEKSMR